jgi:diguanylate cyclase (GGDEF)-like protein/PAS domain S-box-containing protein
MTDASPERQSDSHPNIFLVASPNGEDVYASLSLHGDFVVRYPTVGEFVPLTSYQSGRAEEESNGSCVVFDRADVVTLQIQWSGADHSSGVVPVFRPNSLVADLEEPLCLQRQVSGIGIRIGASEVPLVGALEQMADHVAVMSMDGRIEYVNAAFEVATGKPRDALIGHHIREAWNDVLEPEIAPSSQHVLGRGEVFRGERANRKIGDALYFDEVVMSPLRDDYGTVTHVVVVGRDTTARKISDPLTGLQSRWMLLERIRLATERAKRHPEQTFALLFVDIDRFKAVNDTYGKDAGDEVLRELGRRMQAAIREIDVVGHVSHLYRDEFGVLLEDIRTPEDADRVAERLDGLIRAPIVTPLVNLVVTASIGIVFGGRANASSEEVIRDAETAMMRAKHGAGSHRQVFVPQLHHETTRRQQVSTDLHRALGTDELKLYYQPIVDLRTGATTSAEALIRWLHPDKGMISPMDFIPAAEETGLIVPLGERVLREACRQMRLWQDAGLPPLAVSVNVSACQFGSPLFIKAVEGALLDHSVEPRFLKLEVTESTAAEDPDSVIRILKHLRELGIQILLDDFGTGYSSLSYLTRLPLDKVKIDKSFIRHAAERQHEAAVVGTIIAMGKNLGLGLIAEGVETEAQLRFLQCRGCEEVQGFFFSKPVPAAELAKILEDGQCWEIPG